MKLLLLLPVAAALAAKPQSLVSFGKEVLVPSDAVVQEVVAIGGSARVDGKVNDSVVVVGGPARVEGIVGEDLVVIGSATLGPKAIVDGDLVVIGGTLDAAPTARIKGDRTAILLGGQVPESFQGSAAWAMTWLRDGPLKLRLLPPSAPWAWWTALFFLLAYAGITALAPAAVEACAAVLEKQPVQALLAGVLGASFLLPVSLLFFVSIAGIALLPALLALVALAAWVGKAGLLLMTARQAQNLPVPPAVLVLITGLELMLAYAIPVVGLPLWALTTAWGLGAGLLAAFEAASRQTAARRPVPSSTAPASAEAPAAAAVITSPEEPLAMSDTERAGFGPRAAAVVIDVFAVAVIAAITPVLPFGLFAWAAYQIGLWAWKGTTLGGMLVGIRGVRLDGKKMDLSVAVVRHLASYLSAFAGFLGFFWAAWDPEGQTWHDKLAGTVVVRTPKPEALL